MQQAQSEKLVSGSTSFSPLKDFFFSSQYNGVVASGVSQKINQPALDGANKKSLFQEKVRLAFDREKKKGVKNPIIIGSIPFDVSQSSCLYIPESFSFIKENNSELFNFDENINTEGINVLSLNSEPNEDTFKSAVTKAVDKFNTTRLEKAVLSRVLNIELSNSVSPKNILQRLVKQNPGGFHFSIPQADGSVLLGASPELLIRQQGREIISNPLAGSAKRQPTAELERQVSEALLGSVKDRFEHKLVIDEIQRLLAPLCSHLDVPTGPSLVNTPAMWHLSTQIHGTLNSDLTNVLQLACLLHPTPAVCGYPFDLSKHAISELEPYERGMFTGMVGWCDSHGNGEWAVTIRCGKVLGNTVKLFAGAGIVDASCPQSEWAETEAKLGTMLNAFGLGSEEVA
ncbi:isochorismate synthase MenF [Photobacterium sp. OFAV2-7]|uniref:isochorismate synthase n=1 Tax=Photobacterium sp. OFAV2-7 TaxID=2917748 RepID=UPI001EF6848C|nr:isochorismate synthase [Photobacterium sp. OFAV2-7]MCG7584767.1 isochorismate synthase [Photobacterium sp. OFAV2-7]